MSLKEFSCTTPSGHSAFSFHFVGFFLFFQIPYDDDGGGCDGDGGKMKEKIFREREKITLKVNAMMSKFLR